MTAQTTQSFVPLTPLPPTGERQDFRVKVLPRGQQTKSFQSIEARASSTQRAAEAAPHTAACEPRVSVQREGDHVSSIRIQCSCGQIIDLACVYQKSPAES